MKAIRIFTLLVIIVLFVAACSGNQAGVQLGERIAISTAIPTTQNTTVSSTSTTTKVNVVQYTYYRASAHKAELVGIVSNDGGGPISAIQLHAILINQSNKIVGTSDESSDFQLSNVVLSPGRTVGFRLDIINEGDWSKEDVEVKASAYNPSEASKGVANPKPITGLVVSRDKLSGNPTEGYILTGIIRNNGSYSAYLVNAAATAYDANGKVVDVAIGFVLPSRSATNGLQPAMLQGESAQFEAHFQRKGIEIARYEVIGLGAQYHG